MDQVTPLSGDPTSIAMLRQDKEGKHERHVWDEAVKS